MACNHIKHQQKTIQQGITLIEALIALLIMALGVLGLAQVEARMLAETRTTNSRAVAIQLIADLRDRINIMNSVASAHIIPAASYSDSAAPGTRGSFPSATLPLCDSTKVACTPRQLISIWRQDVANSLLHGLASIYQVNPHRLQVMVAWQLNENSNITLNGSHSSADQQLAAPLQITSAADRTTDLCTDTIHTWICHVDFIDTLQP